MHHEVQLIGGPFCGARVVWETSSIDFAFKNAVDSTYVWYRLSPNRREAHFWPMVDEPSRRGR
jgi:hypothetical protein